MIELICDKNRAFFRETEKLTSGSIGVTINFVFSPEWDDLLKTAVFEAGDVKNDVILTSKSCEIPPEVLAIPGKQLLVGVFGELADKTLVIPTIYAEAGTIKPGASPSGMTSAPPSPSWPEQVQAIALEAKEVANSVRTDAELGKFNGKNGTDGGWYTPAVTQPDENTLRVAFTPSKEDMPAVADTDITLPAGGGGSGSSENPMRLVRSLTLTEAASVVNIDTDDYGNSFTLKECYLYVKAAVESDSTITYIPNGYWVANTYIPSLQKAVTSYAYPFIFHAFGTPDWFWGYEVSSKGSSTGQAYNAVAWDKASYCNYITSFRVNGPFAADARFYLFGRDA